MGDIQQINQSLNEGPPFRSKLMMDFNESKFALFREEPSIVPVKSKSERLSNIEFRQDGPQFSNEV